MSTTPATGIARPLEVEREKLCAGALELAQEGPHFRRHPGRGLPRIGRRRGMGAIEGTEDNRISRWAARVVRADVASSRRQRHRRDRAPVPRGERIGLGRLGIAGHFTLARLAERTEVGDRLASRGRGQASAGMANRCAENPRARASKRRHHGPALAEPLQLDPRHVDAQIVLDRLEERIHEGQVRRGVPDPADCGARGEDGGVVREIKKPEVRRGLFGIAAAVPRESRG